MNDKLKIMVSAYACEPDKGSEPGVGWNWVLQMSKYFDLWVITRLSNRETIERYIYSHPEYTNIHFIFFDLPKWIRFWKKGMRGVRVYYNIWQLMINHIIKKVMIENDIEIFHHLTYGNSLWTVSKYGQSKCFIWGPTGGVDTIEYQYSKHYDLKCKIIEAVRRTVVGMLRWNIGFQHRCKNANCILCKSYNMQSSVPQKYKNKAVLFTDVAIEPVMLNTSKKNNEITEFLTVGKLDPWRGFDLVLEAFKRVIKNNPKVHLAIIGNGNDYKRLRMLIDKLDLNKYVSMLGNVSIEVYRSAMAVCDVVINSCLKEGAVTTSFDAVAYGKPLICIDTGGYTRYFSSEYSYLIRRGNRKEMIDELQKGMECLCSPSERESMSTKAKYLCGKYTWEEKGIEIRQMIEKTYAEYKKGIDAFK
jgi:glycosyltransferase involved in cell wall biosynthesis